MKDLVNAIQELCYNFAKFHYEMYLDKKHLKRIPDEEVSRVVHDMFDLQKEKELKTYIRASLKSVCKQNYNGLAVETTLSEIFNDKQLVINRIILEIQTFQNA